MGTDKGVDEDTMKEFDREVDSILEKPDIRTGKSREATSSDIDLMEQDLQNIMDAKESQDNEGMEDALNSFDMNRKTLKDKGVDESTMKGYDYEVDAILEKKSDRVDDVNNAINRLKMIYRISWMQRIPKI